MLPHESLLARLVAFDTTSRNSNRACIDFIRDYLSTLKIRSEIVANDEGSKACLWATLGPEDKPGIVLAGHTDVVPVDGQQWTSDPFQLTERDGKFIARGSADMKGFIACALAVLAELAGKKLTRAVHVAFTDDEEVTMAGAIRLTDFLAKRSFRPPWVWIGEPTGLRIVNAHKGVAAFTTSLTGVSGHSSQPDKGLNAIEMGASFMDILRRTAAEKRANPMPQSRFEPPYTTFNLGTIKGGTAENIIAEHCEVLWQVRAHPGDPVEPTLAAIEKQAQTEIGPKLAKFPKQAAMKTCACFNIPPLLPTEGNPGEEALARLTGHNERRAVSFATEAGFFQNLGTHVVVCGPGAIEQAHQPDEFIERSQLSACMDLLRKVLMENVIA